MQAATNRSTGSSSPRFGAGGEEELGDLAVAGRFGQLVGRAIVLGCVVRPAVRIDAVVEQEAHPVDQAACSGPLKVELEIVGNRCGAGPEAGHPRARVAGAEAELEEQLQMESSGRNVPL